MRPIQEIAAVKDHSLAHGITDLHKINVLKFRPLGQKQKTVTALGDRISIIAKGDPAKRFFSILQRFRVINPDLRTLCLQKVNDIQSRGTADIIGIWFKRQPPDPNSFILDVP